MYDDLFEDEEKTYEDMVKEVPHATWCALNCLHNLNDMVEKGIMAMSDGGDPPMIITDRGLEFLERYWTETMKRKINNEEVELGMMILKNEGLW